MFPKQLLNLLVNKYRMECLDQIRQFVYDRFNIVTVRFIGSYFVVPEGLGANVSLAARARLVKKPEQLIDLKDNITTNQ